MVIREKQSGWKDSSHYLENIFVEKKCLDNSFANKIIENSGLPVTVVEEKDFQDIVPGNFPVNLQDGKKTLLLCENKGEFLKKCPGTKEYRCCGYQVINVGMGCPMDCTYCILQAYLNNPYLSFFVNIEDMFFDLNNKLQNSNRELLRIGTGEFTDSMALDRITGLSRLLIKYFADKKNAILELKSKSAFIDNLEDLDHGSRTVMAWSLNSTEIMEREEFRASSLEERLEAAAICASWGYHLAFHFDPIFAYPGWQEGYKKTIGLLFEYVPPSAIRWISLGGFRYIPKLKQIVTSRFPDTNIFYNEFIEGLDTKQRYFRQLRVDLYKEIYNRLRCHTDPETCIYFCMESDEIWQEVMGFRPLEKGGLAKMLDMTFRK